MARYRSRADGFTLLEALLALTVLGVVVVAGLESVGLGVSARVRAADYAELRMLAERKMAEVAMLSGPEIEALAGEHAGRFAAPFEDAEWRLSVRETEAGAGLYRVRLEVSKGDARLEVMSLLNRYGELWARRRQGEP